MANYIKLVIATLLPVIAAIALYLINKYTKFRNLKEIFKQVIYGIVFGLLAVLGTEWGVPINGAQINCRDAAVLIAGLLFGGPSGIIAGLIGGIERWFSVYWGVSSFTRVACSVSTIIAGFYGAAINRLMLEKRKPSPLFAFSSAVVMEVFHLTMVFITNQGTPNEAMAVVRSATGWMVIANGLSVLIASLSIVLVSREKIFTKRENTKISMVIQEWLLLTIVLAFLFTSTIVYSYQTELAMAEGETSLVLAIEDTKNEIMDVSNKNILSLAKKVRDELSTYSINEIKEKYEIAEIDIIGSDGIIKESTNADFTGYDMSSGSQSLEFMCLLGDTEEYVQAYGPIAYDNTIYRKYAGIKYGNGFIQIGYDAEEFQRDLKEIVKDITKNRHVGDEGFILVCDENLGIVSAPSMFDGMMEVTPTINAEEYIVFSTDVFDVDYYGTYSSTEGYYIISFIPKSEVLQHRNVALYTNTFMEVLVFAAMFAVIYGLIKIVVVNQLNKVNESLAKISSGNLSETVEARKNVEFSSLSDDINRTVDTLKHYIDEASKRIDEELEFAKQIQSSALPKVNDSLNKHPEYDIFASMRPAKEVGGDFYDFYYDGVESFNILVADVSGKGIPAAMFMMRAKAELKGLTESGYPLDEVFTQGNDILCTGNEAGMFVTAFQGRINLGSGHMEFVNAGHNPPIIYRKSKGTFEVLKSKAGFVLAGMEGFRYKPQETDLEAGDIVYLYTDGVTEALNSDNELYGEKRLLQALSLLGESSMRELCQSVSLSVDEFSGDTPQADDITMLAIKFIGPTPRPRVHFDSVGTEDINTMIEFMEETLAKYELPMKTKHQLDIAIDEIVSNVIKHGYEGTNGPLTFEIYVKEEKRKIYLKFIDEGIPYNPLHNTDPDVTLSVEERNIGGLGIFMVKKSMDDIKYKYENKQNILTIMKEF